MTSSAHFKIEVFVPESHTGRMMADLARIGVGRIGNYEFCFSITRVDGTWRPLDGAQPYLGEVGKISQSPEHKLEVNCAEEKVREALKVIRRTHPYEQPVINVIALANHLFREEDES